MNDNYTGTIGFLTWGFFTFFGMFTAQSWSLIMGGLAGLCTAIYFGAKAFKLIKDIVEGKEVKDEED